MREGTRGLRGVSARLLCWDPEKVHKCKVLPSPRVHEKFRWLYPQARGRGAGGGEVLSDAGITLYSSGEIFVDHGTFCSVSLDDSHMCS